MLLHRVIDSRIIHFSTIIPETIVKSTKTNVFLHWQQSKSSDMHFLVEMKQTPRKSSLWEREVRVRTCKLNDILMVYTCSNQYIILFLVPVAEASLSELRCRIYHSLYIIICTLFTVVYANRRRRLACNIIYLHWCIECCYYNIILISYYYMRLFDGELVYAFGRYICVKQRSTDIGQ